MLRVQRETIAETAERRDPETNLIVKITALVVGIVGIYPALPGQNSAEIFVIAIFCQNIQRGLFHHHGFPKIRNRSLPRFRSVLDHSSLHIPISLHLQTVKLDLVCRKLYRLLHNVHPVFKSLARMPVNKFYIRIKSHF